MEANCIELFSKEYYPPAFLGMFQKTKEYFDSQEEKIWELFGGTLNHFFESLSHLQGQDILPAVSDIKISFLFTGYYFGKPQFQLDAYSEGGYLLGESLLSERFSAEWMTQYIEEMKEELLETSKKESMIRFVRPAQIEVFGLQAVRSLLYYFGGHMKYLIPDCFEAGKLSKVRKSPEFYLSFGEFMDWQRPLLARLPEVDIFNCDPNTPLTFRTFRAIYYEKKSFSQLKLDHACFKDCTFLNCTITDCSMRDVLFENCRFNQVSFEKTSLLGCSFAFCRIEHTKFRKTECRIEEVTEDISEVYKEVEFYHCTLEENCFEETDLSEILFEDCEGAQPEREA